jgi:hypothetical protein
MLSVALTVLPPPTRSVCGAASACALPSPVQPTASRYAAGPGSWWVISKGSEMPPAPTVMTPLALAPDQASQVYPAGG